MGRHKNLSMNYTCISIAQTRFKTIAPEPELLAAIRAHAKRTGKANLSMRDIDREIKAYRQAKRQQRPYPYEKIRR